MEDQNGQKHYTTEVIGSTLIMLDSKAQDTSVNAPESPEEIGDDAANTSESPKDFPDKEDDLPF